MGFLCLVFILSQAYFYIDFRNIVSEVQDPGQLHV